MITKSLQKQAVNLAKMAERNTIEHIAKKHGLAAFLRIVEMSKDEELRREDPRTYILANGIVIERAFGKVPQPQQITGEDGGPVQININITKAGDAGS